MKFRNRMIEDMYEDSKKSVKTMYKATEDFRLKVGVHRGFALSPYLFYIVMDEVTKEIQGEDPGVCLQII